MDLDRQRMKKAVLWQCAKDAGKRPRRINFQCHIDQLRPSDQEAIQLGFLPGWIYACEMNPAEWPPFMEPRPIPRPVRSSVMMNLLLFEGHGAVWSWEAGS
jgi:hypothetical protein